VDRAAEKNGVNAMRMPVDDLLSNWAYMVMSALAWKPESLVWIADAQSALGVWSYSEWNSVVSCISLCCCRLRLCAADGGSFIGSWGTNSWLKDFFASWEKLRRMAPA